MSVERQNVDEKSLDVDDTCLVMALPHVYSCISHVCLKISSFDKIINNFILNYFKKNCDGARGESFHSV